MGVESKNIIGAINTRDRTVSWYRVDATSPPVCDMNVSVMSFAALSFAVKLLTYSSGKSLNQRNCCKEHG